MSSTSDTEDRAGQKDRSRGLLFVLDIRQYIKYPSDLAALSLFLILGTVAVALLPSNSNLRFLIAVPLLFFCPGYAVIALLYPAADDLPAGDLNQTLSRTALSFGLSLAVVPVLILTIGAVATPGVTEAAGGVGAGVFLITQMAVVRRLTVSKQRRYQIKFKTLLRQGHNTFTGRSYTAKFTLLLLIAGIILSSGAVALTVSSPPDGYEFTQFYVGTENENGSISTVEYPDELTAETSLTFVVENHEEATQEYVVVVQLQRVNDAGAIQQSEELDRYRNTINQGGTWEESYKPAPEMSGENLRLQYLLYRNEPPVTPTKNNSYRNLHIWITVDQ